MPCPSNMAAGFHVTKRATKTQYTEMTYHYFLYNLFMGSKSLSPSSIKGMEIELYLLKTGVSEKFVGIF